MGGPGFVKVNEGDRVKHGLEPDGFKRPLERWLVTTPRLER